MQLIAQKLIGQYCSEKQVADVSLLSMAMESLGAAICITDTTDYIVWVNDAFLKLSGYTSADVIGRSVLDLEGEAGYCGMTRPLALGVDWSGAPSASDEPTWRGEIARRRKDGAIYIVDEVLSNLFDASGKVTHHVLIQHDMTQRLHIQRQAQFHANHDALTGLTGRAHLLTLLKAALSNAGPDAGSVGVLFIDLDGFKAINDSRGHCVGDALLKAVAERMLGAVRCSDTLARYGGDEFVLLLPLIGNRAIALRLARELLRLIALPFSIENQIHTVSASVGIAFFPEHGSDAESLLAYADRAMYLAKRFGGNRFHVGGAEAPMPFAELEMERFAAPELLAQANLDFIGSGGDVR